MTNQTKNSNIQKELGRHGLTAVPESCNQTSVVSSNQFGENYAKLNVGIGTRKEMPHRLALSLMHGNIIKIQLRVNFYNSAVTTLSS